MKISEEYFPRPMPYEELASVRKSFVTVRKPRGWVHVSAVAEPAGNVMSRHPIETRGLRVGTTVTKAHAPTGADKLCPELCPNGYLRSTHYDAQHRTRVVRLVNHLLFLSSDIRTSTPPIRQPQSHGPSRAPAR